MMICKELLFIACGTFSIIHLVQSQNQRDYLPMNLLVTNITYISDAGLIYGGKTSTIQKASETDFISKPYRVLRYFPDGLRNCYSLSVMQDTNYLIRTVFVYGIYDGLNIFPRFDLYLGPNIWKSLDLRKTGFGDVEDIIHITGSNVLDICLVKAGTSTPLISAIEVRPLRYDTYAAQTGSLKVLTRLYFTNSNNTIMTR
ncbi:unnamed protein product [Thlaspi arvense]|uniref:Malectin-like domain-containing protein n=1 Tax=Thlaspi arvense TaxID=13288 RepID=A0AAU9T8G1_THLAR|nr:unnamed protein product [Thlaspi arvense]